jgi:hypothetical protein
MIKYIELGENRLLNQIVMAGSHDAGITSGAANVQTQNLDIAGQAKAGVRVFDLRIAAQKSDSKHGKHEGVQLKAFHGAVSKSSETRFVKDVNRVVKVEGDSLKYGEYGMGLNKILKDAKTFVTTNSSEFLILKFDKCSNWKLIAEACVSVLGDNTIYKGKGSLNTTPLKDLKGKVVVVFTSDGIEAVRNDGYPVGSGILGIKNLYGGKGGGYSSKFDGMQYHGKGGTKVTNIFGDKLKENEKKQGKIMTEGAGGEDPNVMGMMYWTTTGLKESIQQRNDQMWTGSNVTALKQLWKRGLADSIHNRLQSRNLDLTQHSSGGLLKTFMPNIVMIDFADDSKCKTIYELNKVAAISLSLASSALSQEVKQLEAKYAELQRNMRRNG